MKLCEYGCGQEAKYQFKNGKWCCNHHSNKCPKRIEDFREKSKNPSLETRLKMSNSHKNKIPWMKDKKHKLESIEKIKIARSKQDCPRAGIAHSKITKKKIGKANRLTLQKIKERWPLLLQVEEIKEISSGHLLSRCKNNQCKNSKNQNGWFFVSSYQISQRLKAIYFPVGFGDSFFYCSDKCKSECSVFNKRSDPYRNIKKLYTQDEYETFRQFVLERDNYECQYCGKPAIDIHHERPQKLEPLFVLDPDFAWSCCEECHYQYGHKTGTECSTGNLANKIC